MNYSKIKNKTQKIHVPILLNGNKAIIKFIFKFVFYTSKYNSAKTKHEVPPTTVYQNLPQKALSSFKLSVFKTS